jgi:hypothetical protein
MKALALVRASLWLVGFAFLIGGSRLQAAEGWVERYVGADTLDDVTYGAGLFADVGGAVYTSPDGVWWTRHALDPAPINSLGGVAYGNGRFVAVEPNSYNRPSSAWVSTNGISWQRAADLPGGNLPVIQQVAFCSGTFLALGQEPNPAPASGNHWLVMDSTDGVTWGRHSGPTNNGEFYYLKAAAFGNGSFVVVGLGPANQPLALISSDLTNWTAVPGSGDAAITFGQGKFVTVGHGKIATSPDGIQWTSQLSGLTGTLHAVSFAADTFVAAGEPGLLLSSTNAITWRQHPAATDALLGVTYGNNRFVAGGGYYTDVPRATAVVSGSSTQAVLQAVGFVSSPKPGFQVLLNAERGHTYRLQASPALPATSWTDVLTITLQPGYPGPPVELLDPNVTSGGQRSYRAISP